MDNKTIEIACQAAGEISLSLLKTLQGDLKILAKEDYERLKYEILRDGFSFPIAVWTDADSGNIYILDGHQRVKTLEKMRGEGYSIPQIPVVFVEAQDINQAKHKLLAAASQYGQVKADGLTEFLKDTTFNVEDILGSFRFADLDLQDFVTTHLSEPQADVLDLSNEIIGHMHTPNQPPPDVVDTPESEVVDHAGQVRMVQLFLDGNTHPEFMQKIAQLQNLHKTSNLTETVMEVVRAAYSAIESN